MPFCFVLVTMLTKRATTPDFLSNICTSTKSRIGVSGKSELDDYVVVDGGRWGIYLLL